MLPLPSEDRPSPLAVEGEMTIYQAMDWKARLVSALDQGRDLELDLSGVTEIDTAGIQLLIMAKREAARHGRALRLFRHSPPVLDAIGLFGLEGYFGDPILLSGVKEACHEPG